MYKKSFERLDWCSTCSPHLKLAYRVMKITYILLLAAFLQVNAKSKAQINLSIKDKPIEHVFKEIRKQTGYDFLYGANVFKQIKPITLSVKNVSINQLMSKLLGGSGLTYKIHKNNVTILSEDINPSENVKLINEVRGIITDSLGKALPGVSVRVKGRNSLGTSSDQNGRYILDVPQGVTLVFSLIGYEPKEVVVGNDEVINILLKEQTSSLEEVAVVAFGTQKKISLVGSQSTINPEELKLPVRSLSSALAGRLAGVVAVQRSGAPGYDNADLLIRGVSTFASSPQGPLIVIDGVPGRSMNNIDPEDVESFTILKDASATAVYGTRGANGVMLIETKKGKVGKPLINVELNRAVTQFTQLPEFVNGPTYMQLYNEGLEARGRSAAFTESVIQKHITGEDLDLYPNVDWFKTLFNPTASNERVNMNVKGGSENARYYVAAGYFGENGLFKQEDVNTYNSSLKFSRFNFLTNVDMNVTRTTKLSLGISGAVENNNYGGTGISDIFNAATKTPPHLIPPIYSNGQAPQVIGGGGASVSPYVMMTRYGYTTQYNSTVRSNVSLNQDLDFLIKGLSARTMFSYDSYNFNRIARKKQPQTYFADAGRDANGNLITSIILPGTDILNFEAARGGNRNFYTETSLNYKNTFGLHDVSALLLYNESDYINGSASTVISSIPFRLRGLTGRATYGYNNKYFIESNFGYSGSENFSPKNRYGFFPSIGAGWVVSNEKFFSGLSNVISYLKLRYTYGLSGNSDTQSRFLFLTTIADGNGYIFGAPDSRSKNNAGLQEGMAGAEVSWETAYKQNLGIELNVLDNDLQLIVELFKEKRDGILVKNQTLPNFSGLTVGNLPYANIGKTENKGVDLTLNYNKSFSQRSFVTFRGTFTYNQNLNIFDGLPPWAYPWLNRSGQRISQRFGLIADGFFESADQIAASATQSGDVRPGDIRYKDLNGDNIIDSYDQTAIGYGDVPAIIYGLSAGFGYKGFDINMFFQGAGKVDFYYAAGESTEPFKGGANVGNLYTAVLDRWTVDHPNPNAFYPRLSTNQDITSNYQTSSHWVKRSDYLRLKSAEIGYNFESKFLKVIRANKMRVFVNGTNLLTFSKWKIWDPELGDGRGTDYPNISTYNVGLRLNFQ